MDRESVYTAHVYDPNFNESGDTPLQIQNQLEQFILNFRLDNRFIYRYGPSRPQDMLSNH